MYDCCHFVAGFLGELFQESDICPQCNKKFTVLVKYDGKNSTSTCLKTKQVIKVKSKTSPCYIYRHGCL